MRKLIETRFQGYQSFLEQPDHRPLDVVARLRDDYQKLHDQPIHDPGVQEARYREIEASEPRQALKEAMNEWCAVWFWLTDEGSLRHVPTPETFLAKSSEARSSLIRHIAADLKFFHWELEFPDVFTPDRTGFDALTGNPPWDVNEASSLEFFSDFDPLYRTYDKQAALRRQSELFAGVPGLVELWDEYNARFRALGNWTRNAAEPFAVSLARGKDGSTSAAAWARRRQHRKGYADPEHPFRSIGTGKQNMYKLFCEVSWNLLSPNGRLGIILPTGIYSDFGTKELRELLLFRGRIDLLYAFQNEKKIFAAADHRRTKPLRGGKDPGLVHKPSASATRPIDSDFAPCLYQRAAPCYSSAWLRLAAASVRFFTSRSPGTLPRTRPLPIYSIYIKAKAVPVAASSSEIASARPTGPEFRPRSFTALRIQHSSKRRSRDVWGRFAPYAQAAALDFALTVYLR